MDDNNKFRELALQQGHTEEEISGFLEMANQAKEMRPEPSYDNNYSGDYSQPPMSMGDFDLGTQEAGASASLSSMSILPIRATISQKFGNYNPKIERFSGGINRGTDYAVPIGTPVRVPDGEWVVAESFGGANPKGYIGDKSNNGYGNSIVMVNRQTGERMRVSHLSKVGVRPGEIVKGGQTIALSGSSGNSTGGHLDLEYFDATGKLRDVSRSSYKVI